MKKLISVFMLCVLIVLPLGVFADSLDTTADLDSIITPQEIAPCPKFGFHQSKLDFAGLYAVYEDNNTKASFSANRYICACGEEIFTEGAPHNGVTVKRYVVTVLDGAGAIGGYVRVNSRSVLYSSTTKVPGFRFSLY